MQVRTSFVMGLVMLTACAAAASAQISLSSAVDLALKSDPRVKISEAAVTKAAAALRETYDVYVPSVSADAGYGKGVGVPTGLPIVFSLSAQSLVYNFSQKDNIRAASAGLQAAKLALKESRDQVAEDVLVTYLNLDNAQRRQAVMADEHGLATKLVMIAQERLDAGEDKRVDVLRARRSATQIQLLQLQTDDQAATLSDHLARLIGMPGTSLSAVSDSIPALPSVHSITEMDSESFGVQSAFANARSKQEIAFGAKRYRLRPEFNLEMNYSRIDTAQNDYTTYYPDFGMKSEDAESIGLSIRIPLFDRRHEDEAHQAAAEAARTLFEAQNQKNQFLEGRLKLQHSTYELSAQSDLAEIDRDLAQEQINAILVQLSSNSGSSDGQQMTPEDEQKARMDERAKTVDLLNAQFELSQAEVNLLRQTGQLDDWLKTISTTTENVTTSPITP